MTQYIELIEGCQNNHPHYQKALYNHFGPLLMSICYRYTRDKTDAEDVLQEAFINIFRSIDKFKHEGSFEGWLKRITVNCALRFLEKRNKKRTVSDENIDITFEANILDTLQAEDIICLIAQLPEGYRTIFNLNVLDGYKHKEIAEMLNIKESSSRSQLLKARNYLKKLILEQEQICLQKVV